MAAAKPLKVYTLAGQSNMEGHARVETFDYIGDDPKSAPLLRKMCSPDGKDLGEYPVEEEFVHDCLAVAGDCLYVSTADGKVLALGRK